MAEQFDYIVVGGGSAGSAIASRLSEDRDHRVLLLEAGPPGHPISSVPLSFAKLIDAPSANWCYRSEPEEGTSGREIPVPRGRVMGGSSTINGMVWVRGQRQDFDTWAQLGNRGWSYDDVLPLFKGIECYEGTPAADRGRTGPLRVGLVPDENPLYEALYEAGRELGLPENPDYNGEEQEGIVPTQVSISGGKRMSAALAYLKPVMGRDNLAVRSRCEVDSLVIENGECTGVRYRRGGQPFEVTARAEVIVCGGAINSPKLLELSGIGNPDVLGRHGIEVVHALPGVGENLRDHIAPRMVFRAVDARVAYNAKGRGLGLALEIIRYGLRKRGLLSLPTAPVLAFLRTRPELASPDVQIHFVPYRVVLENGKRSMGKEPGITCTVNQCRPESQGTVHIRSAEPREAPAIHFNFLDAELDRRTLVGGMRAVRDIMATDAVRALIGDEMQPGADVQDDDALVEFMRARAETAYHPVGTCRMGSDPNAVVDERLRVHGMGRLRVADGSIMPTLTSGNTNAPCIMIGEKCAAMVREDARG